MERCLLQNQGSQCLLLVPAPFCFSQLFQSWFLHSGSASKSQSPYREAVALNIYMESQSLYSPEFSRKLGRCSFLRKETRSFCYSLRTTGQSQVSIITWLTPSPWLIQIWESQYTQVQEDNFFLSSLQNLLHQPLGTLRLIPFFAHFASTFIQGPNKNCDSKVQLDMPNL